MTDNKETPEGAPCPPLEDEIAEAEQADTVLAKETDADYEAEETNAKEVKSE